MITVIIKRTEEPKVIQMTQYELAKHLNDVSGAEIILADNWREGLHKVRTPYVSIVEPDCTLSANYYSSNVRLMNKIINPTTGRNLGGGYNKMAMLSSCLGIKTFGNRVYNYELKKHTVKGQIDSKDIAITDWRVFPERDKKNMKLYHVQIGFVPGAIIRFSALKDIMDDELWLDKDLVKLSTALSLYFWDSNRRIEVNPNTTYVSNQDKLDQHTNFTPQVSNKVWGIFTNEGIGLTGV